MHFFRTVGDKQLRADVCSDLLCISMLVIVNVWNKLIPGKPECFLCAISLLAEYDSIPVAFFYHITKV